MNQGSLYSLSSSIIVIFIALLVTQVHSQQKLSQQPKSLHKGRIATNPLPNNCINSPFLPTLVKINYNSYVSLSAPQGHSFQSHLRIHFSKVCNSSTIAFEILPIQDLPKTHLFPHHIHQQSILTS